MLFSYLGYLAGEEAAYLLFKPPFSALEFALEEGSGFP
jgi:hypothetical protein